MATPPLDPLEVLRSARDAAAKVQDLVAKVTLPAEQRRALTEGVAKLVMPGEQLQAMVDLAEAFGPPHTQIAEIQKTLAAQRSQVEQMLTDLERVERNVERLAQSAEQIATLQAPMRALLDQRNAKNEKSE